MKKQTIRALDTISSLSSGLSNIVKDVLGLTITIISYGYMVDHLALFDIKSTLVLYILGFIGKDFVGYWSHRFEHKINILWNRHIIHHSSEEFNLSCALRQNVSVFFGIFFFLYVPMAILGIPQEVVAIIAPLHLFAQFWYHTTLINKMGFLEHILVTPSHHRVHHAINDEYIDTNFSQIFIVWDKWFGTFQAELENVPAVYGTKKPAHTWNPFIINFMHLWQLVKDAFRTKSLKDKARIWFMPTGWRPSDVQDKFPINITEDPYTRIKYETPSSYFFKVWHWIQLIVTLFFILYMFNHITRFPFTDILLYAGFIGVTIFSYTLLMDKNPYAFIPEIFKVVYCLLLVYKMEGWYLVDNYFGFGTAVVIGYCLCSLAMSVYFILAEVNVTKKQASVSL